METLQYASIFSVLYLDIQLFTTLKFLTSARGAEISLVLVIVVITPLTPIYSFVKMCVTRR